MKLAVVVIHGMGTQDADFADPMIAELNARIEDAQFDASEIAWKSVFWSDLLAQTQKDYVDSAKANPLGWMWLRRWVIESLGDAAAYQNAGTPTSTYASINTRVRNAMQELYLGQLGSTAVPLVVLAHSLGSQIMSSYIWDTQRGYATGADAISDPFLKMKWLAGMITFGSPIPLFTFSSQNPSPIAFPGSALAPDISAKARWDNYYDKDDVLGWPLKAINGAYDSVVDEDIPVNVGNFWRSRTPLSHTEYWTDNNFTEPVAAFLTTFL